MKPPGIGIAVTQTHRLTDDGTLVPEFFKDVLISGNQAGLLKLADLIHKVALSEQEGYHTHLYPTDETPLVRTEDFSLTIEKNSLK
jgi:hypothetical protein